MRKTLLSICLFAIMAISLTAQNERVEVVVNLKNGKTVEGLMTTNYSHPWKAQKSISLFDKSLLAAKKIKNSQKEKYKARDIVSYEADGRTYESHKVMIQGRGDAGSTLKALPSYALIEKIADGAIIAYRAYGYPPDVVSGTTFAEVYDDLRRHPEFFVMKKGDKKMKSMHNMDITKWIADAPNCAKKYDEGGYGNFKRKEGKKLGNFLKGQMENENAGLIVDVINDYNAEVGN